MPRTVPDLAAQPSTLKLVSVRYVDSSGTKRADSYEVAFNLGLGPIEDFVESIANATNANVYEVQIADVWRTDDDAGNAINAPRASVSDNLVVQMDGLLPNTEFNTFLPAPTDAVFLAGTDQIDPAAALLLPFLASGLVIAGGAPRTVRGARFTERKKRGRQVRF